MSIEDMQIYLDVQKNSILKDIFQLNEFFKSINLPTIQKKDNFYSLNLSSDELKIVFENFETMTTDEKIEYLYIKFIANGFLNLENERKILDISRSTILRYFQVIKDDFSKTGTTYEYNHRKGLSLKNISVEDKAKFCKRIMKLFIEEDFLVPIRKELLNSLKKFDTKQRLIQLYSILKDLDIVINYFLLSFFCSLDICIDIFGGFRFINKDNEHLKKFKKIKERVDEIGYNFDATYKNELSHFLTSHQLGIRVLDEKLSKKSHDTIESIKKHFKLKFTNEKLKKMLFYKIYLSFFKYDYSILKVLNVSLDSSETILLNNLEKILKDLSYELYLTDKCFIVLVIKKIIIDENFANIKKVLLLFNEVTAFDNIFFKDSLIKLYPEITFHIEATFFHKKNIIENLEEYDLTISDNKSITNAKILNFYDIENIHKILQNYALKNGIKKFRS